MKFKKIIGKLAGIAPTVAQGLAGPLAGVAVETLAKTLGLSSEDAKAPEKLEKALEEATPEQMSEIKRADNDFKVRMKELNVDLFDIETKDTQDARKNFGKDWTARVIALISVSMFGAYIFMVTIQPPDQNSEAVINLILGYLGGIITSIISFYFGASHKD
jgi:hypothetical protein